MTNPLVGRTITSLKMAKDKLALLFEVEGCDPIRVGVDAYCCSYTWIENIEVPALGFPAKVVSVDDIDLPGSNDNDPEHDCLQVYGCKIITDRGELIIDYRNSSNGYYGGNLSWPGEYHYGGVYNQNDSEDDWADVT